MLSLCRKCCSTNQALVFQPNRLFSTATLKMWSYMLYRNWVTFNPKQNEEEYISKFVCVTVMSVYTSKKTNTE